jgi:hypothetical protein
VPDGVKVLVKISSEYGEHSSTDAGEKGQEDHGKKADEEKVNDSLQV